MGVAEMQATGYVQSYKIKIREGCLKWYSHVLRRPPHAPVCKCEIMMVENVQRGRSTPKMTKKEVLKDLKSLGVHADLEKNRI